jgi:hypothetical protein
MYLYPITRPASHQATEMNVMILKKPIHLLLILFLAAGFAACKKKKPNGDPQTTPSDSLASVNSGVDMRPDPPPFDHTVYYSGKIGGKYAIDMELGSEGDRFGGSYRYQGKDTGLTLSGSKGEFDRIYLTETDASGKKTGFFSGYMGFDGFRGTWYNGSKTDSMDFFLERVRERIRTDPDIGAGGFLTVKNRKLEKKSKNERCTYQAEYPEFGGLPDKEVEQKLNANFKPELTGELLESLLNCGEDEYDGFEEVLTYEINSIGKGVVSVTTTVYSYYAGAAHGNYGSVTENLRLSDGTAISNADLFLPGYEKVVNVLINEQINQKYSDYGLSFDKVDPLQNYEIKPEELGTYFDPYVIGAYAAGQIRFSFPYEKLKTVINPKGPLAAFLPQP